jgi:hypothetical protein
MWHVGIDLHRATVVLAAVSDSGQATEPRRIDCQDTAGILEALGGLKPFRAVIEATGTYRWFYDLLAPHGTVLVAHPLRLRAMVQRRSKTDKLDSLLLANLLRIDQIPFSYVPPESYQRLREITRFRVRLTRGLTEAKVGLRALLAATIASRRIGYPSGPGACAGPRARPSGRSTTTCATSCWAGWPTIGSRSRGSMPSSRACGWSSPGSRPCSTCEASASIRPW